MSKSGLAIIIGAKPKKGMFQKPDEETSEEHTEHSEEESSDFDTAAEELFAALKESDSDAFKSALKAAIYSCKDE